MIQQKYLGILHQSKESIFHSINQLNHTLKVNQQKNIADSLLTVLSSIANFDEDFIINSMSQYAADPILQDTIGKIITQIKSTKQSPKETSNPNSINQKQEAPATTLRVSSEIVRSSSKEKEPAMGLDGANGKKDGSSGFFGVFGKILGGGSKAQKPKAYKMILPQKQSKAVYDPIKKKWIFEGEEQEPQKQIPKPPPKKQPKLQKSQTQSQQSVPKQVKKSVSQIDEMTAPPSFKRRGQTKSTGGFKKMAIKEEIIPTTLVEEESSPLDSLMNMIDKEFYKLQENLEDLERGWRGEIEKEMRRRDGVIERKLNEKIEKQLSEEERKYVEELNGKIREFNETSALLMEEYIGVREESMVSHFDMELGGKLMQVARDNTIIARELSNRTQSSLPFNDIKTSQNKLSSQQVNREIHSLTEQINNLQGLLQTTRKQAQQGGSDLKLKSSKLQQTNRELNQLKKFNQDLKDQLTIKEGHISELELKLAHSMMAARLLEDEKIEVEENGAHSQQLIVQLETTIQQEHQSKNELLRTIQTLQNTNHRLTDTDRQLSAQIQQLTSTNNYLQHNNQELQQSNQELRQSNQELRQSNQELVKLQQVSKIQLSAKLEDQKRVLEVSAKQQQLIYQQTMKNNLEQLQSFAQSIAEESLLLVSIQAKQLELRTHSDRSSENSSKKSQVSQNQQPIYQQPKGNSFLNISDILTQLTQQYIDKISVMNHHLTELEHHNKTLTKTHNKQKLKLIAEVQSLKKSLNTSLTLNEGYKKTRKQLQDKICSLQTQSDKTKKKLQLLRKQQQTNKQLIQQTLYEKHNHSHQLSMLQSNNETLQNQVEELEEQLQTINQQVQSLNDQVNQLNAQLQARQAMLKDKETIIGRLKTQIEEEQEEHNLYVQNIQIQLKGQLKHKDHHIQTLKTQIDSLKKDLQHSTHHQNSLIKDHTANINSLTATRDSLTAKLNDALFTQKQLTNQLNSASIQLNSAQIQLAQKEDAISEVSRQLLSATQQLQGLTKSHRQAESLLLAKKNELAFLSEELRTNQQEQAQLHERLTQYIEYSTSLKEQLDSVTNQNSSLQTQIHEYQQKHHELIEKASVQSHQQLQQVVRQKEQLQMSLMRTMGKYSQVQREFYQMQQVMEQKMQYLTEELSASYQSGQTLSHQLSSYSELVDKMDLKITQLQTQISQTHNSINQEQLTTRLREIQQKHQQEIQQLLENLDEKETQIEQLKQAYQQKERQLQQKQKQLQQKSTIIQQKGTIIEQKDQLLAHQQRQLEQQQNQLAQINAQLSHQQIDQQGPSPQQHELLLSQFQQLNNNYAQIYQIYEHLQAKSSSNHSALLQINSKLLSLCKSHFNDLCQKYSTQLSRSEENQEDITESLMIMGRLVDEISIKCQLLVKEKDEAENALLEVTQELQQSVQSLVRSAQTEQQLRQQRQSLQTHNNQLQSSIQQLSIHNTELEQSQSELLLMIESLQRDNQAKTEQLDSLQREQAQTQLELDSLQREQAQTQLDLDSFQREQAQTQFEQLDQTVPKQEFLTLIDQYEAHSHELQTYKRKLLEFDRTMQEKEELEDEIYELKQEKSILLRKNPNLINTTQAHPQQTHNSTAVAFKNIENHPKSSPNDKQTQQLTQIVVQLSSKLQTAQKDKSRLTSQMEEGSRQLEQQKQIIQVLRQKLAETQLIVETLSNTNLNRQSLIKEKNQAIHVKDTIISQLSTSLEAKQQELQKTLEQNLMLSSKESRGESQMENSYNSYTNSLKETKENMYATGDSRQPKSGSVNEKDLDMEELLEAMNLELEQGKAREGELVEIIAQQETQIAILKEKYQQLKSSQQNKQQVNSLQPEANPHDLESESHDLYTVIEEMQKELQAKNKQVQELRVIVENLDNSVGQNQQTTTNQRPLAMDESSHPKANNEQQMFSQVSDNLSRLAEEVTVKEEQLRGKEQEIAELKQILKERQNEIENQKMYAEILKDKEEQQQAQIARLVEQNQQQDKKLSEPVSPTMNKQQDRAKIENLMSIQQDSKLKIEELETLLSSMEQEINAKDELLLQRGNQIHSLKQGQLQAVDNLAKLNCQVETLNNSVAELEEILLATNAQLNQLKDQQLHLQTQSGHNQRQLTLKQHQLQELSLQLSQLKNQPTENPSQSSLKQLISQLQAQIAEQKEELQTKDDQIQELTELINSQAEQIQQLQASLKQPPSNYHSAIPPPDLTAFPVPSKIDDQLALLKVELEEVYQELRNKKIQVDQLRKNLFDVNQMFTQRQAKYQAKIKTLSAEIHKYDKTKDAFNKYQTSINQLEAEVANLSSEKTQFLRVIENLQKQLVAQEKQLVAQEKQLVAQEKQFVPQEKLPNKPKTQHPASSLANSATKPITMKREPASQNKLRSTRSQIIEPVAEIKPTGFFGSISSLFMTPIETERMAKKIVHK